MNDVVNDGEGERIYAGRRPFGATFLIVVVAAITMTLLLRAVTQGPSRAGGEAPPIRAAGWLNGPGPSAEDLKGRVIVIDAWAYWCGPCRLAAPEVVNLYHRYRDKGVVFLGLTGEGKDADEANRQFLKETGFEFPNGYGAVKTLTDLKADYIPQKWVINRRNRIVWDDSSLESIETAIDRALKETSEK